MTALIIGVVTISLLAILETGKTFVPEGTQLAGNLQVLVIVVGAISGISAAYFAHKSGQESTKATEVVIKQLKGMQEKLDILTASLNKKSLPSEEKGYLARAKTEMEKEIPELKSFVEEMPKNLAGAPMDVALIIAHSESRPGVVSSLGEETVSEYSFTTYLANKVQEKLKEVGISSGIFSKGDRPISITYASANISTPKAFLELHTNSYNGKVSGSEALYEEDNAQSKKLADIMVAKSSRVLGIANRGTKPALAIHPEAGIRLSMAIGPSVILEPFFIDNLNDLESALVKKDCLASEIVLGLIEFLNWQG